MTHKLWLISYDFILKLISEARQLKSIEPLLDDKDLKKVKDISQEAAR